MKNFVKAAIAFSFLFLFQMQAQAQKLRAKDMVVTAHGWYGTDMERTRPNLKAYGYTTYEASVGFQTNPNDSSAYARQFGYPMLNFGFSLARMGEFKFYDQTKFSDLYSLYGSFERSLLRKKRLSLGYLLDFGATYNPDRYDPVNNPGNNWLSSPVMAYFGAGAFIKFHVGRRWEIGADAMFRHYSNGRLALPNEALNALGAGLFARYRLDDYDYKEYTGIPRIKADYKRGMQYMIVLGGGVHTCMAEWNAKVETEDDVTKKSGIKLKAHPKLSISVDALYRYALRYASGVSLDVFYSSNMKELEASDRIVYGDEAVEKCPGYSPISVGLALVHEVYWHNLAVHVAVGAYPYRHKGVNGVEAKEAGDRERGWHYEKAGLRYYFPKLGDTFLGFAIKSHSVKAEYLEFSAGVRI
ncbi:MAG: acyloxyacyl hydrolase [Bacteroidaceae bacterium]|nr:acyloxyacyl hydrolase [Bacteroidaceae bacterium]